MTPLHENAALVLIALFLLLGALHAHWAFGSVVDALAQRRDPSASSTLAEQSAANGSAN